MSEENIPQNIRQVGDPPADDVIKKIVGRFDAGESRKIFDTLIRNIDIPLNELPEEISQFVHNHSALPAWADADKIKAGQNFFNEHGPAFLMMLYFRSLPFCYVHKLGAPVLTETGRLAYAPDAFEKFSRRIAETGQFLLDVVSANGFQPGGRAIQTILRVRLIHASIRHFVSCSGHWNEALNGVPINQEDLAFTLTTFGVCITDGLEKYSVNMSANDLEGYHHLWSVAGYILGIEEKLIPETIEKARAFQLEVLKTHAAETTDGKILADALVQFSQKNIPFTLFDNFPVIVMRDLLGNEYANMLGIKRPRGFLARILPGFLRRWLGWLQKIEDSGESKNKILDKLSLAVLKGAILYFDKYKNRKMVLPESWLNR